MSATAIGCAANCGAMASKFANKQCFLRIVIEVRSAFLLVYLLVGDVRGMTGALLQSFISTPALSAERCARALLIPDHFLNIQERHDYASNRPANGRRGQVTRRVLEDGQNQVQQMRLYLVCLLL